MGVLTGLIPFLTCALVASPRVEAPTALVLHDPWLDHVSEAEAVGQVRDPQGRPLAGARVRLTRAGTSVELRTDAMGCFRFPDPRPGAHRFDVEAEGHEPLTRAFTISRGQAWPALRFILRPTAGAFIEVASGMEATVAPKLRSDIISTETLPLLDIRKTNALSLTEAVDRKPGISIQTECSLCNVRNVVLNNLPGRFTTILIDGVPIFSSVSSAYGLDMVGVNGVEAIEISRGAGVSLSAPEALSGSVNVVSRRPRVAESLFELQGGPGGYRRMDGFWGQPMNRGALSATFLAATQDSLDGNGNGISEHTGFRRVLGGIGFFADGVLGWQVRGRVDGVDERRAGGALGPNDTAMESDRTGNPFDWSRGRGGSPDPRGWIRPDGDFDAAVADGQSPIRLPDGRVLVPYEGGRAGFRERVDTRRQQGLLIADRDLGDNRRLHMVLGAARHHQDSFYEGLTYRADQQQVHAEGRLQWFLGNTLLTTGLSHRFEDLRSRSQLADGTAVDGLDNYVYRTHAAFLQVYHAFLGGILELNSSLRHDRNNVFGGLTTPRASLLWHHTPRINSRFAVGRGFRLPTSFFEQDHGILETTRIDRDIHRPETSENLSYTFSSGGERMALVLSASFNRIRDFALLDSSARDPLTGVPVTRFTQSNEPLVVRGVDATWTLKLPRHVEATFGAESYRYRFTPGTLAFARPEERVYLRFDHDHEGLSVFARATWTGPQDLGRFYDYAGTPRFNLGGTPKRDRSPAFWIVDASATWSLGPRLSLVLAVNNLLDVRQTDVEDFLWIDATGRPDFTHVWGPGQGRSLQAGLRWNF